MSTSGRANISGINSQMFSAISLFLQYLKEPSFIKIVLEAPKMQDFVLVFKDGHKIICENKDHARSISYPQIKKIINGVMLGNQLNQEDEILIVCSKLNSAARNHIEHLKYWPLAEKELRRKNFNEDEIKVLRQVRFWEVQFEQTQNLAYRLFYETLNMWLPEEDLKSYLNNLIINKIYERSAKGEEFTSAEIWQEIEQLKKRKISEPGMDDEDVAFKERLGELFVALDNPKNTALAKSRLIAMTVQPYKMYFLIDRLQKRNDLNLKEWDALWKACMVGLYSFHVFEAFKNNLQTKENRKYVIGFLHEIIPNYSAYYRSSYVETDTATICAKILKLEPEFFKEIFDVLSCLIIKGRTNYFYLKPHEDNKWREEEICKVLKAGYLLSPAKLQTEIISFINKTFNLVEDDHQYWHYTPPSIFEIIAAELRKNPAKNILAFKRIFVDQYDRFYSQFGKGLVFSGWELMGSGISQAGDSYSIHDRHFLALALMPALNEYYAANPSQAWQFMIKNCIERKKTNVTRNKPDFMNRACIDILLKEFLNGSKHKREAYSILADFIKMRKGIPHKSDIIFSQICGAEVRDENKWALVKVALKYYELPINPFMEKIIADLASKNNIDAVAAIISWITNPKYTGGAGRGTFNVRNNIEKLLSAKETFNKGIKAFESYISQEGFKQRLDNFDAYKIAELLALIVRKDYGQGLSIYRTIYGYSKLTINQQILLFASIDDVADKDIEMAKLIVDDFLTPMLETSQIKSFSKKVSFSHAREQIVRCSEKLAKNHDFERAFKIVSFFIDDPDPQITNKEDDPKGEYNYHKRVIEGSDASSISTVRGYCSWALQEFVCAEGRDYIEKIIPFVEKQIKDENFYIRVQSTVPLMALANIRHCIEPGNAQKRFLPIEIANKIESMAFAMLEDESNRQAVAIVKRVAMVFSYFRSLNHEDAYKVLNKFWLIALTKDEKSQEKIFEEVVGLLIFYSEFRKDAFKDDRYKAVFGAATWQKMNQYDDGPCRELLERTLTQGGIPLKIHYAWHFWQLPKEDKSDFPILFEISYKYLSKLAEVYNHSVYERIYHFVDDFLDKEYDRCISLWKKCLINEKNYWENASKDEVNDFNRWLNYKNNEILMKVAEKEGEEEFLKWLDHICNYPRKFIAMGDVSAVIALLKKGKNIEAIAKVFPKLLERDTRFYEDWKQWATENKVK